jgi:ABC-type multidrug transport system ATPase subunit
MAVMNNPKIIVLDNFTEGLSNGEKDSLSVLLRMLKNKYFKIIILVGEDTDYYYKITDYVYIINDDKIIKQGKKNILKDIELLNKLNIKIPYIIEFIEEYKKHNKEINDYDNILDLIKAIYRDRG